MNVVALTTVTCLVVCLAFVTFSILRSNAARDSVDIWLASIARDVYRDIASVSRASDESLRAWLFEHVRRFAVANDIRAFDFVSRTYVVERLLDFVAYEHTQRKTIDLSNSSTLAQILRERIDATRNHDETR